MSESRIRIIWSNEALVDLEVIFDFLAHESQAAAGKVVTKMLDRVRQLSRFPESGSVLNHDAFVKKTYRSLVEGNYRIIYSYSVERKTIYIEVIFDTRRNPDALKLS